MNPLITEKELYSRAADNPLAIDSFDYMEGAKWSRDLCTAEHERRMADLRQQVEALTTERNNLTNLSQMDRMRIKGLEKKVEALGKENAEAKRTIEDVNFGRQIEWTTRIEKEEEIRQLEKDILSQQEARSAFEGEIEVLRAELNEAKSEHGRSLKIWSANDDQQNAEIEGLKGELAEAKERNEESVKELLKAGKNLGDICAELAVRKSNTVPRELLEELLLSWRGYQGARTLAYLFGELDKALSADPSPAPASAPLVGDEFLDQHHGPSQPERKYRAIDIQTDVRMEGDEYFAIDRWNQIAISDIGKPYRSCGLVKPGDQYRRPLPEPTASAESPKDAIISHIPGTDFVTLCLPNLLQQITFTGARIMYANLHQILSPCTPRVDQPETRSPQTKPGA